MTVMAVQAVVSLDAEGSDVVRNDLDGAIGDGDDAAAVWSDLDRDASVRLDPRCIVNWSLVLDLQILGEAIAVVLRGSDAY